MTYITPNEANTQQYYSLSQQISFDFNRMNVSHVDSGRLHISFRVHYDEGDGEEQQIAYDGHLSMFSELKVEENSKIVVFYKHYNLLTSFIQLIEKETVYSHTPSMIDQTIPTLDPQLTKSRNKTQHTRVVIFADDKTSLNSSTRLTLSIANTWKHFTSSSLDIDELEVKITDVKLWYKKTQASETTHRKIYSIHQQQLTNTQHLQTVQFRTDGMEHYLFAINRDIHEEYNTNMLRKPTNPNDASDRGGDPLPLRFYENPITKKYDDYIMQQHSPDLFYKDVVEGEDNGSYKHKLKTYIFPSHLQIRSNTLNIINYGVINEFNTPRHLLTLDARQTIKDRKDVDVCENIAKMYRVSLEDAFALLTSHHHFTTFEGKHETISVTYSRPTKPNSNPNYIGNTMNDMLCLVSVSEQ